MVEEKYFKVENSSASKGTDHDLTIPLSCRQDENSVENSCVWLATSLVIRSIDEPLAEVILKQYHDDPPKFECLYMFKKDAPDNRTLFNYLQWTKECYFSLRRAVKPSQYDEITVATYILQKKRKD